MTGDWTRPRRAVAAAAVALASVVAAPSVPVVGVSPVTGAAAAEDRQEPLLAHGMRGPHVERWQGALNGWLRSADRPWLSTDGIFGPRTLAATRALQRTAGIPVDGVVGPQTRAALARLRGAASRAPFQGTVGTSLRPPSQGPVAVTDVRFGSHEGFDRVVFDLAGSGRAGWQVRYVDSPVREQGSGAVVPLTGDGQLEVVLTGISLPGDVGGHHYAGPRRPALGRSGVVADLYVGNLFEGRFATWIGTRSPERFRVFGLDGPQRVVVDIAHTR